MYDETILYIYIYMLPYMMTWVDASDAQTKSLSTTIQYVLIESFILSTTVYSSLRESRRIGFDDNKCVSHRFAHPPERKCGNAKQKASVERRRAHTIEGDNMTDI